MAYLTSFLTLLVLSTTTLADTAAFKPPLNNTLEPGVATECKTCPYKLCTNKAFYDYNTQVSLTCWTKGTSVDGDSTWLKTSDGCFVTQYDLADYNGTCAFLFFIYQARPPYGKIAIERIIQRLEGRLTKKT
jgi:hypothetical protein